MSAQQKVEVYYDDDSLHHHQLKAVYYVDQEHGGELVGTYTEFFFNGNKKVEGTYRHGEKKGEWRYFFESSGVKLLIERSDTSGDQMTQYYENGEVKAKGPYVNNKRTGHWTYYYETGVVKHEGGYLGNNKNGDWTYYFEDGSTKAMAIYDKGNGIYREYFIGGKIKMEGPIVRNHSEGVWTYYFPNGQVKSKGLEVSGVKSGYWEYYHENGELLSRGDYIDGKQMGNWIYYHDNGNVSSEGPFKDGFKDNHWKLYHRDGGFKGDVTFNQGDGPYKEYYPNGKIKVEGQLKRDKNDGLWKYYYEDGTIEGECEFVEGEGSYYGYYKDGSLKMKGTIRDGQKVGIWEFYDKDGNLTGQLKTLYSDEQDGEVSREKPVKDSLVAKVDTVPDEVELPNYRHHDKSKLRKQFESIYFYKPKPREHSGVISSANPFSFVSGVFSSYLELYWQERLGLELGFHLHSSPFFRGKSKVFQGDVGFLGFGVDVRQKLYHRKNPMGMIYYSQTFRYKSINYYGRFDLGDGETFKEVFQNSYEVTGEIGTRLVKDVYSPGLTFDLWAGIGVGYRNTSYDFDDPDHIKLFTPVRISKFYVPLKFGFSIGYMFL